MVLVSFQMKGSDAGSVFSVIVLSGVTHDAPVEGKPQKIAKKDSYFALQKQVFDVCFPFSSVFKYIGDAAGGWRSSRYSSYENDMAYIDITQRCLGCIIQTP